SAVASRPDQRRSCDGDEELHVLLLSVLRGLAETVPLSGLRFPPPAGGPPDYGPPLAFPVARVIFAFVRPFASERTVSRKKIATTPPMAIARLTSTAGCQFTCPSRTMY